uniref:Oxygen sensor histidine kinase NreB n=1 Tax=uncultured bacterium ws034A6 TaxID=1131824 RepID=I1X561_9BACT|nr:GAF sensor signal transduction histidine kinase [uncultured bacterium ws034A6]
MSQTITNTSPAAQGHGRTLRSRLLLRLAGLLVILAVSTLLFVLNRVESITTLNRTIVAVILFTSGAGLLISTLLLVQTHLLDPLSNIRSWARKKSEGRYADPIPSSSYSAFADLANDLNSIGASIPATDSRRGSVKYNELELEEKSLQILYEVVSSINTAHGLDDLLTRFLYTLKRITYAQAAAIWVLQKEGTMDLSASSGIDESLILPERPDVRRCLYERAATEGKIWVEPDLGKCEKIAGQKFFAKGNIGLVSIPMRYRGKVTGVINLFLDIKLIEQIDSLKPLLTSIAHHLSIAIEKSQSEEESCQHLLNEERIRIAHELHDSLAQTLASLRLQIRVLDETLHQNDESATWQQLERIENSMDLANSDLRGLIANFRAPAYKRGLLEAIEQIVSQFRSESHMRTYFQKEWADTSLSRDAETQILRIIQEALWNVRKHSQAKTVRIMLKDNLEGKCHILIEDDGIGFNKQAYGSPPGEHIGLTIMRERAARLGGKLRVESEPGEGTRVVLELNMPGTEGKPA